MLRRPNGFVFWQIIMVSLLCRYIGVMGDCFFTCAIPAPIVPPPITVTLFIVILSVEVQNDRPLFPSTGFSKWSAIFTV